MKFDKKNQNHLKSEGKFSFPYNGENAERYLKMLEPYQPFVHDIFLSLPNIPDFFSGYLHKSGYYEKCKNFLELVKDRKEIKTVITLNGNYSRMPYTEKQKFIEIVIRQINNYNIYGAVVSDFTMAEMLHNNLPNLVLNTSCNVPQYKVSHLNHWKKYAGVEIINVTRDSSFDFKLLKEFKEAGYKIKLLLNEQCHYKCPNICSFCNLSSGELSFDCTNKKYNESPFQTCTIIPRWLDKYDDLVDIYKITGRYMSSEHIFNTLEHYINRDDYDIQIGDRFINTSLFPDKLLYCGHMNCDVCKECDKVISKIDLTN